MVMLTNHQFKLISILLIALVTIAPILTWIFLDHSSCTTEACLRAVKVLKLSMDMQADPCDDFYQYTCGKLIKPGNTGDLLASPFREAAVSVLLDGLDIISKIGPTGSASSKQLQVFFESCIRANQSSWAKTTRDYIDSLGGWNPKQSNSNTELSWIDLAVKMNAKGLVQNHFVSVRKMPDLRYAGNTVIVLDYPHESRLDLLQMQPIKYINLLDIDISPKQIAELETIDSKLQTARSESTTLESYASKMTLQELNEITQNLDTVSLVQQIFRDPTISGKTRVVVPDLQYLVETSKLLNATDTRIIINYMMLKLVEQQLGYKPTANTPTEQAIACFVELQENLGLSLGAAYAKAKITEPNVDLATEIVDLVRNQIGSKWLEEATWVSPETKHGLGDKANAIDRNVAYLDFMDSDAETCRYFSSLELVETDSFFDNILKIRMFTNNKMNSGQMNSSVQIFSRASEAAVYYQLAGNSINIMPAVMQGRLFDGNRTGYLNFGSLGLLIGRELVHGFDAFGLKFDQFGNLNPKWVDEASLHKFSQLAECFVWQYEGKQIENTPQTVSGRQTLVENIADNVGIRLALEAYKRYVDLNGSEPKLPGVTLNQEQLFWASLAGLWCDDSAPSEAAKRAAGVALSPARVRVNVALANQDEFSRAFNCPPGSRMNAEIKCRL